LRTFARSLVEIVRHPMLVLDAGLRVVLANERFRMMFGAASVVPEGASLMELDGGRWDRPGFKDLLDRTFAGEGSNGSFEDVELVFEAPGAARRVVFLSGHLAAGDDGRPLLGLAIEEGRQTYSVLAPSETPFHGLMEAAPDAIILVDKTGIITQVNGQTERLFGYTRRELLGKPVEILVPDKSRAMHPELLAGYVRNPRSRGMGEGRELFGRRKDGSEFPVEISLSLLLHGTERYFISAVRDVTSRKQAEEAIRVGNMRFRVLVDGVLDYAIYMLDEQGNVLTWNIGAERLKGYKADEIVGHNFAIFYPPKEIERGWPQEELRLAATQGRLENEAWRVRKDGSRYWANDVITALHDGGGRLQGFAKVTRDLTERMLHEKELGEKNSELVQASRQLLNTNRELFASNGELEAFCFSVSHDLRTPLRTLDGFSQELLIGYADKLDEQGRHYLQRVRVATKRMDQLIDDLLKLSRVTRAELLRERVDLSAIAENVIADLRELEPQRNVTFTARPGLIAECDPRLIRVVLENLIGNAWKFTSKKSTSTIAFDWAGEDNPNSFVVRDDGAGFDMAYTGKLFGAFQRLHSDREFMGTGIGLATVQRIIRRHGGEIRAEAAVGRGAAFIFTLPSSGERA